MVFYPYVGFSVFWIGLITAIILYAVKRSWYPVAYLISAALYVFAVAFVIDVFDLGPNGIMGVLAFSAFMMIGAGYFILKKVSGK
ncbi:MAG TPA: hypothetical protein VI934_01895 [Candidatus Nanoarchaeia archaeon]|nr:hypothetical protein [Candidatus Nanoarchaeia archaeon]